VGSMRYHIYNNRDATKPIMTLPTKWFVFTLSGLIYKRWEYFLAVDSAGPTPIYEWIKTRRTDGTVNMSGPRMVRNADLISRSSEAPKPMLNYHSTMRT